MDEFGLGARLYRGLQSLRDRIAAGPGYSTPAQRRHAMGRESIEPLLDDYLERVRTRASSVGVDDAATLRTAGISRQAAIDALMVAFSFNLITRVADSFGWAYGIRLRAMPPRWLC